MQLIDAMNPGLVLRSEAVLLTTRDEKWLYRSVELIEEVNRSVDITVTPNKTLSRTFLAVAEDGVGFRHVVKVLVTFDGVLEIMRAKGFLI